MGNYFKNVWNSKGVKQVVSVFVASIVLCIIFGIYNPNFLSKNNFIDVFRDMSPYVIVGIGQALVLITGNIDLSIGSVYGSSAMISALMMSKGGVNPYVSLLVSLIFGVAIGFVNGQLVSRFKLPPFIATLGTMFVGRGIAQFVNDSRPTSGIASGVGDEVANAFRKVFYTTTFSVFGTTILIALLVWALAYVFLSKTKYGRHVYAIGSNSDAARLSGVSVSKTTTTVYMISGFCAALAGVMSVAKVTMASPDGGNAMEMYAVAVAVIGGISTLGGIGILQGVIIGAFMWIVLEKGLILAGFDNSIKLMVIGIIVVLAVGLDIIMRKVGDRGRLNISKKDKKATNDASTTAG